mgnify:CR=1 FL=1
MHITHEDARQRQDEQIRQLQAQVGHIRQNTNEEVQAAQSTWIPCSVSFLEKHATGNVANRALKM